MRTLIFLLLALVCGSSVIAQPQFGPEQILAKGPSKSLQPQAVYATDLDGDGDNDVLSASAGDDKIAWYENERGTFGPQQIISEEADWAVSIYAADLDGDADPDVLSASSRDNKIAWYENMGGTFSSQRIISTGAYQAREVYATDLDGDGLNDVLAALAGNDQIVWYKNRGGTFGAPQQITRPISNLQGVEAIHVGDIDLDGDPDVLSASSGDNKIAWYPNNRGTFGRQQVVTFDARGAESIYAADLSGDSDADVLVASWGDDTIAWYENLGGTFGPRQLVTTEARGPRSVYATDLDLDNDLDILSASANDNKIAWYENIGGSFTPQKIISTKAYGARDVYARDLTGNGAPDVIAAATGGNKITWYENQLTSTPTNTSLYKRPDQYSVAQNYPNPFNPTTRITYTLPEPSFVILSILDIAGRPIDTLIRQQQRAGHHGVTFNGRHLSSGLYLYHLRAGSFEKTREMLLLK